MSTSQTAEDLVTTLSDPAEPQAVFRGDTLSPARQLDTDELDDRVSALFRRWPSLSADEMTTLRDLYDELLRRARRATEA